jgi:hypothetical protein
VQGRKSLLRSESGKFSKPIAPAPRKGALRALRHQTGEQTQPGKFHKVRQFQYITGCCCVIHRTLVICRAARWRVSRTRFVIRLKSL